LSEGRARGVVTIADVARAVGGELSGGGAAPIIDVTHDSREVGENWLFVAIRGAKVDAHAFVADAARAGAAAVISERERPAGHAGAWVRVADARRALALAAAEVHAHPSRRLRLVGLTGTNGKTTTAFLVAALGEAAGERVALISTVEYRIAGEREAAPFTTPESSYTQRVLRRAVERGCRLAVMEASSQALDLRRCDALRFEAAAFTNLTRDHLDYHGTMENYFDAKLRLFDGRTGEPPRLAIVNTDDPYGRRVAEAAGRAGVPLLRYGLDSEAEVTARSVKLSMGGMRLTLVTPAGESAVVSPLVGRPHVYNLLTAAACGHALGLSLDSAARAFETCAGAPGRFERVAHSGDFAVVVDYAHTDDALAGVLRTARDLTPGRVITVFGCGGERDRTKRAPMGEIAASLSDVAIATSDNPRGEDPAAILADIEVGLKSAGKPYEKVLDRREAIRRAVLAARDGDLVLIAGKGHEDYQIIGGARHHFDDREVAREALSERGLCGHGRR
jgi:UDP-N-acetylmuramoyl-L-alanyl-D-glutamate--2,6-diaminopimelate ligase